jgi:hypothetical protein
MFATLFPPKLFGFPLKALGLTEKLGKEKNSKSEKVFCKFLSGMVRSFTILSSHYRYHTFKQ